MGMFDNIDCELPLPDKFKGNFQTKDFDRELDQYVIRNDGLLFRSRWGHEVDAFNAAELVDFTGKFDFYTFAERDVKNPNWKLYWHEYTAFAQNGRVTHIKQVSPEAITMQERWRYEKPDGTPVWLAFDPNFACIYCNRAVGSLSMGGPAICPSCDAGVADAELTWVGKYSNSKRRLRNLPIDPEWSRYEVAWKLRQA